MQFWAYRFFLCLLSKNATEHFKDTKNIIFIRAALFISSLRGYKTVTIFTFLKVQKRNKVDNNLSSMNKNFFLIKINIFENRNTYFVTFIKQSYLNDFCSSQNVCLKNVFKPFFHLKLLKKKKIIEQFLTYYKAC